LIIHHKTGTNKSYAFTKDYIPSEILGADLPWRTEAERLAWYMRRRIGAVGMLWNRASDAWLGLSLSTADRMAAFDKLLYDGKIIGITVEGMKDTFYCLSEDLPLIEYVMQNPELKPRCELIAPLDSLIWDRKIVKALFGFGYTWEIYTPAEKRRYGAYVLPILYGDKFIGRIEPVCDRKMKTLVVKNIWYEDGVKQTMKLQSMIKACLRRFADFNECVDLQWI